jgi:multisubunit Na+/H+ antiporter MnhC subunit
MIKNILKFFLVFLLTIIGCFYLVVKENILKAFGKVI